MVLPAKDETATTLGQLVNCVCFLFLEPTQIYRYADPYFFFLSKKQSFYVSLIKTLILVPWQLLLSH